ncbi:MAG: hypothetical protein GEU88_18990 [Solirubrobacterales bacterium]|nr:hypothetical protein [Solirubrobacterales bacterium]
MEILLVVVLLLAVAWFVTAPLRARSAAAEVDDPSEDPVSADLEARKEALYRQIRDAELDREQGKLSPADWQRIDADLRREAIEVLRAIDAGGR